MSFLDARAGQGGSTLIELMVALVVLGVVVAGTVDGLAVVSRQTMAGGRMAGVQEAVREAVVVLENLPANSPYLADDGPANDLFDTATPDYDRDPRSPGTPWVIEAASGVTRAPYRIFYNVLRDVALTNTVVVKVYAAWDTPDGRTELVDRTFVRPVAP